jgi:hypothetical protein
MVSGKLCVRFAGHSRAGKIRNQSPKVAKQEDAKKKLKEQARSAFTTTNKSSTS